MAGRSAWSTVKDARWNRKKGETVAQSWEKAIAKATTGLNGVPDWPEVMKKELFLREPEIRDCAKALWMFLSADAKEGIQKHSPIYTEAVLIQNPLGDYRFGIPGKDTGRPGWHWDGVITDAYISLWLSLKGKIDTGSPRWNESSDEMTRLAKRFRLETGSLLKKTENIVNIETGGGPARKTPQWFIARDWNDALVAPVIVTKERELTDREKKERRLTPEQAGETRQPQPVATWYVCQQGCAATVRFDSEAKRDDHNRKVHSAWPCRGCNLPFGQAGNRKAHERIHHPDVYQAQYPIPCEHPACMGKNERFDSTRGLGQHMTVTHELSKLQKDAALRWLSDNGSLQGYSWPNRSLRNVVQASRAGGATATVTRLPEATQPPSVATTAAPAESAEVPEPMPGREETMAEAAVAYIREIVDDLAIATVQNTQMRGEIAGKDAEIALLKAKAAELDTLKAMLATLKPLFGSE